MQKRIAILGSSGSIGQQTLEVISHFPKEFTPTYLTVNNNAKVLLAQIQRYKPKGVVVLDEKIGKEVRQSVNSSIEVLCGEEGLLEIVQRNDVDIVVSSLVGFAGLKPTIKAIEGKKKIALAIRKHWSLPARSLCLW